MYASRQNKPQRNTKPALEHLDMRIAPAAMGAAVALAAELKVEGRQVHRWEAALATAQPGSSHQRMLSNHIARTEAHMNSQDIRLARIDARTLSGAQASPMYIIKGQAPTHYPPSTTQASPMYIIKGQAPTHYPPSTTTANPFSFNSSAKTVATDPVSGTSASASTTSSGGQSTSAISTGTQASGSGDTGSQSSLPSNASVTLNVIYNAYEQDPSSFPASLPSTDGANLVIIQGSNVGIQVHDSNPANFAAMLSSLQSDGMQIQTSSATYGTVVGMLPIAELPAVAQLSNAPSVTPLMRPML